MAQYSPPADYDLERRPAFRSGDADGFIAKALADRMGSDPLRGSDMTRESTDSGILETLKEMHVNPDVPIPYVPYVTDPRGYEAPVDPQEFIRQQLAGDVVPLPMRGDALTQKMLQRRMDTPAFSQGSVGATSIRGLGGQQSPTLDLMDVLMYPTGKPAGR